MKPLGKRQNEYVREIEKKETTFKPKEIWLRAWQEMLWEYREEREKRLSSTRQKLYYALQSLTEVTTELLVHEDTKGHAFAIADHKADIGRIYLELKEL